ncbi:MAG: acyltransferase family protein [Pseudochelatococcus sp.]|jgi:exopolysaccharide production protein ExoZ|uniref:acyltransferase family protein n=1 Tax=Pseudochelatococcus sp. TaxID=2020869 RepID=UPI003D8C2CC6
MFLRLPRPQRETPAPSRRFALVQVLRAVAAVFVVFHHAQFDALHFAGPGGFAPDRSLPWEAGVDIFFVISGFIIVHSSRRLFAAPGAARTFLTRRLIRVVPLYWLATAAFLAIGLLLPRALNSPAPDAAEIAASFLFWPYLNGLGVAQPVFSLGWTLNYEMAFYLVFALAIALPGRSASVAMTLFFAVLAGLGQLVALPMPLAFWAEPLVLEFVFGLWIAWIAVAAREAGWRPGVVLRVLLAAMAIRMLHDDLTADGIDRAVAWGVPAAMLVAAAVLGSEARGPSPLLRPFVVLGDASYALYLFHPFALRAVRLLLADANIDPRTYVVIALSVAVILALAVHLVIERPVTRWLRRRLSNTAGAESERGQ